MLRIVIVVLVTAIVVLPLVYLAVQAIGVLRKEGGFKAWVDDLSSTNYKIALFLWMAVAFTGIATAMMVLHGAFPSSVGEVQIDLVWAIFAFLAAGLSLGTIQFIGKRMTADPQVIAANAAAAGQPVTLQHVESTVATQDPRPISEALKEIAKTRTAMGLGADPASAEDRFALKPEPQGKVIPRAALPRGLASGESGE